MGFEGWRSVRSEISISPLRRFYYLTRSCIDTRDTLLLFPLIAHVIGLVDSKEYLICSILSVSEVCFVISRSENWVCVARLLPFIDFSAL
jgi:hypothetical protein